MDNLQWEINQLKVENRKLREQDPEASRRVDRETTLEGEAAELRDRVRECEGRLTEEEATLQSARRRAEEAEATARKLNLRIEELVETHRRPVAGAGLEEDDGATSSRTELEATLQSREQELAATREELSDAPGARRTGEPQCGEGSHVVAAGRAAMIPCHRGGAS